MATSALTAAEDAKAHLSKDQLKQGVFADVLAGALPNVVSDRLTVSFFLASSSLLMGATAHPATHHSVQRLA